MSPTHSGSLEEFIPASQTELSRFMTENATTDQKQIFPVGGRTSLSVCCPSSQSGTQICTSQLNRVIDYPIRDMTITVEAGMRLDQLNEIISAEGQRLPIDVSQSNRATLGGVIATNTCGPRRFSYGTIRDYVIGISAIDGRGNLFKSGGRVVKMSPVMIWENAGRVSGNTRSDQPGFTEFTSQTGNDVYGLVCLRFLPECRPCT